MPDNKMLQAILDRVSSVDQKVDKGFKGVNKRIDELDKRLTARLDALRKRVRKPCPPIILARVVNE
jgi:hypothetical protein